MSRAPRVAIECGGTFTDLVLLDEHGRIAAMSKTFSTPADPSIAVLTALDAVAGAGPAPARMFHGSTVATNAVLERRGPVLGLVTTTGFGDVLHVQRHDRVRMYDLHYRRPVPLVRRALVAEVDERVDPAGRVVRPLDEAAAEHRLRELLDAGVEALAVCLINSYAGPAHELRLRELARRLRPGLPVSLSCEVAPLFREYERASSTVIDALVRPVVQRYLGRLWDEVQRRGVDSLQVMQSNAGIVPVAVVGDHPLTTILSGPAAGVAGAAAVARAAGHRNAITFDMGGTSSDVSIISDGRPHVVGTFEIAGFPVLSTTVDINTVGAGGGSIIGLDEGGLLRVGPRSAGADPGPAAYGRGGSEPTLTDANVVRGIIRERRPFAESLRLDLQRARAALGTVGVAHGVDAERLAEDACRVANAITAGAVRVLSVERGLDPGDYVLIAYGGAGPLHAADMAADLGIRRVLVPPHAGVLSAYGLLASDYRRDFAHSEVFESTTADPAALRARFADLQEQAEKEAAAQGFAETSALTFSADMRYKRQGFEITIPVRDVTAPGLLDELVADFHQVHRQRYGHAVAGLPVQVVTLRVAVHSASADPVPLRFPVGGGGGPVPGSVFCLGERRACDFVPRGSLPVGARGAGPCVIEEPTTTIFVPPGWTYSVDAETNIVLEAG